MRIILTTLVGCMSLGIGLSGCKNDNSTGTGTNTTSSLAGLWGGTDADDSGITLNVLISSTNQMVVIRSDGVQFTSDLQLCGNAVVGAVDGYTNFGTSFSDGSGYGIGTLDGTFVEAASITATVQFTTKSGTSLPGSWSLTPGSLSTSGSSLTAVTGNFTDKATGATVSITSSGAMTSQDASTGCVLNGTIGTDDTTIDVYQVSYTLESCTATAAVLNGITFTGLGYVDSTTSPAVLTYAVSGSGTAGNYGIVSALAGT